MAFTPISNTVPQYEENGVAASGYFIKFYESGTTTPTAMATDRTGTTLLDKCELNTEGYPINGSGAVFIPHINVEYKIALFRNAADADANDLNNAAWDVDGLFPVLSGSVGTDFDQIPLNADIVYPVSTIAALRAIEPTQDGQQVNLLGHTLAGVGGGIFYYDASDTTTEDDNGYTVVTLGGKRWKRKGSNGIKVSQFGAITTTNDQFTACQSASDLSASSGIDLIVDVSVYLDSNTHGPLIVKNSTRFINGAELLYKDQTSTIIKFTNTVAPVTVTPASVGGLTELSTALTGLPSHKANDFLIIKSDEKLIDRIAAPASLYRKNECAILSNESGELITSIAEDYNVGLFGAGSILLYEFEKVITVNNLAVNTDTGLPLSCTINGLVVVEHCYLKSVGATFKNVRNEHTQWLNNECPSVIHDSPVMEGTWDNSLGYGINNFITGMSVVNDGIFSRFRHAITGRHDKNTVVRGGLYESDIDSHYGYAMIVSDLTIHGSVTFAGRDISFTKSQVYMSTEEGIFSERSDTPEIRGNVTVKNIDVYANLTGSATDIYLIRCGAQSAFTFSNALKKPDRLTLKDIRLHNVSGLFTIKYIQHLRSDEYNYESYGHILIDNVQQILTSNTAEAVTFFTKGDTQTWTRDTIIELRNLGGVSTRLYNTETVFDSTYGYDFIIDSVDRLVFKADRDCIKSGVISNALVAQLSNGDAGVFKAETLGLLTIQNNCSFTYTTEQDLQSILRGSFVVYMLKDSALAFDIPLLSDGLLSVSPAADPYVGGQLNFDENGNYANLIWSDTTFSSQLKIIQDTVLTGTTGLDNDVTASCKDSILYLESRRGTPTFYRRFNLSLTVNES